MSFVLTFSNVEPPPLGAGLRPNRPALSPSEPLDLTGTRPAWLVASGSLAEQRGAERHLQNSGRDSKKHSQLQENSGYREGRGPACEALAPDGLASASLGADKVGAVELVSGFWGLGESLPSLLPASFQMLMGTLW